MKMDIPPVENGQGPDTSFTYSSYIIDFFLFVLIVVLLNDLIFGAFYAPFFDGESSGAFMQFTYYVHALENGANLYWDHYLMLSSQDMPMSPLLSPVTLVMTGVAYLFGISELSSLAYIFAFISYALQALCAYAMYLFLRFIGLSRLAAIVGSIGYCFNYFSSAFGMQHGFFRLSALALMPIVFIFFVKLFNDRKNTLYYLALSGFFLGLTFVLNGDVKPTIYFMPVLVVLAYIEGYEVHGLVRTTWILAGVMVLGALITLAQYYPILETLGEGTRSERTGYLPSLPLSPLNTLLGFSQNPFSMTMGFFFPHSFFEYYKINRTLGIAMTHLHEQKFTYGIYLFLLSSAGVFYRTKRHLIWAVSLLVFILYILGSSTPLWPLFGFISEHSHIRYPTRAAIMPYFFFSIYAAYGIDVLMGRAGYGFYERWAARYVKYILAFIIIIFLAVLVTSLEMSYDLFGALGYTDYLSLFIAQLLVLLLVLILACAVYILWKRSPLGQRERSVSPVALNGWTRFIRRNLLSYIFYISFHLYVCWISLNFTLKLFRLWYMTKGATPSELTALFFAQATFPIAIAVFASSYAVVSFILTRGFVLLRLAHYALVIIISAVLFNALFALGGGVSAIHQVQLVSLAILAGIFFSIVLFVKKCGSIDFKSWKEEPYFLKHSALAVVVLFVVVFVLFISSGFMKGNIVTLYFIIDLGGLKIQREFLVVLTGLVLFLFTVLSGKKRLIPVFLLIVFFGTYLFFYTDTATMKVPPSLKDDPSLVFKRDAELAAVYEDGEIDKFRLYVPFDVLQESFSPELGFAKSHHTYCCRQYKDRLRFAFGQIVGPKAYEKTRRTIFGDYSHPFWKLYNVGYIVDRFNLYPELLPKDPDSYVRLSDMVIKMKDSRGLLSFMDSYEYVDIDDFIESVSGHYALDMASKLYIHDEAPGGAKKDGKGPGTAGREPLIEITEFKSGTLGATIEVDRSGFVVFSEIWAPSWTVYVDGTRGEVVRAYGMLQAVWIEEGTHEILFEFNIFQSWKMKAAVVLSSLAFLFVVVVAGRRAVRGLEKPD